MGGGILGPAGKEQGQDGAKCVIRSFMDFMYSTLLS